MKTGEERNGFKTGDHIQIEIDYKRNDDTLKEAVMGIGIFRNDGLHCYGTNTYIDKQTKLSINSHGQMQIILEDIPLLEGEYTLDVAFHDEYGRPYDYIRRVKSFSIYSPIKDVGVFRIKHRYIEG